MEEDIGDVAAELLGETKVADNTHSVTSQGPVEAADAPASPSSQDLEDRASRTAAVLHQESAMDTVARCLRIGDEEALLKLLDFGAWEPLNICYRTGRGALHFAGEAPAAQHLVDRLVQLGCEGDFPDVHGEYPLHIFTREGHLGGALALLSSGVDVNRPNQNGQTSLDIALEGRRDSLAQLLLGFGGERSQGPTPEEGA